MAKRTKLIWNFLVAAVVALVLYLLASQASVGDWLQPAFYLPYMGAALLSGNAHSIDTVAFSALLVLQCYLVVVLLGWVYGRLRQHGPEA
jgi:hypothetical protein